MSKKLSNFILNIWKPHNQNKEDIIKGKFVAKLLLLLSVFFFTCKQPHNDNRNEKDYHPANGTEVVKEYYIDNGRKRVSQNYTIEKKNGTYFHIDTFFVPYYELHKTDKNKYPLDPIWLQCCDEWKLQKMEIYPESMEVKNGVLARIENSDKLRISYFGKNIRLKPIQSPKISIGLWENTYKNDSIELHLTLQIDEPKRIKGDDYYARLGKGKIEGVIAGKFIDENIHPVIKVSNK